MGVTARAAADPVDTRGVNEPSHSSGLARTNSRRAAGLLALVAVLVVVMVASLAIGPTNIPFRTVWDTLFHFNGSIEHLTVRDGRIARTVLGVLVGMSLGVAGALIQAMTRNPLADPGILGVNAGSALFVALAVGVLGFTDIWSYIWFGFLGAVVATVTVYAIGSRGTGAATPIRLTLSGVAVGALLTGITTGLVLLNPALFDQMRYWNAGSIAGRPLEISAAALPFIIIGLILAGIVARPLNAVSLGDDLARSLGANVTRTRAVGIVAVTLLCGGGWSAPNSAGFWPTPWSPDRSCSWSPTSSDV